MRGRCRWRAALGVRRSNSVTDQRDQRIASTNPFRKHFDEIEASRNVVDVDEDAFASQAALQAIIEPPGEAGRVFPPIADEDAAPHAALPSE
jgi:hypothetical protein